MVQHGTQTCQTSNKTLKWSIYKQILKKTVAIFWLVIVFPPRKHTITNLAMKGVAETTNLTCITLDTIWGETWQNSFSTTKY